MSPRLLTVSALLLSCLLGAQARAQNRSAPAPVPTTPKAAAQESYAKGVRLFNEAEQKRDANLYEAAYLQFVQAYAVFPDDRILWNLGVAEAKTGRFLEALKHLHAYDEHQRVLAQPDHPDRTTLKALLAQADGATGHLTIAAPYGMRIRIDGVDVGSAPLAAPVDVAPGAHAIDSVTADGVTPPRQSTTVLPGEIVVIQIAAPSASARSATTARPLGVGPGGQNAEGASTVSDNNHAPGSGAARTITITVLGVAGLGSVGAGVGFLVAAGSDQSRADQLATQLPGGSNACGPSSPFPACQKFQDANHSAQDKTNTATVLFVSGGIAVAGAVAVFALWPTSSSPERAAIAPVVSPTYAGAQWVGTF
jgi:hypothetical protein